MDRGTGGAAEEGFRDVTGGGTGFNVPGRIACARGGVISDGKLFGREVISEFGRCTGRSGGLRKFAIGGFDGSAPDDSALGTLGFRTLILGASGSFGADEMGGLGAEVRDVSGSES